MATYGQFATDDESMRSSRGVDAVDSVGRVQILSTLEVDQWIATAEIPNNECADQSRNSNRSTKEHRLIPRAGPRADSRRLQVGYFSSILGSTFLMHELVQGCWISGC